MQVVLDKSPKKLISLEVAKLTDFTVTCSILFLVALGFTGFFYRLFLFIKNKFDFTIFHLSDGIFFSVLILCLFFTLFSYSFFEWHSKAILAKLENGFLELTVYDMIAPVGFLGSKYTIKSINDYEIKKNTIVITGDIDFVDGLKKRSSKKISCEVPLIYDEDAKNKVLDLLKEFTNEK